MESNQELLILAVVGMPGSGKSEVLKSLVKDYGFFHLYYGDITFDEIKNRNLEVNEKNERMVREEFRSGGDMGIYSKLILPKIENAIHGGQNKIILESMYNVFEYEIIKEKYKNNFKVLSIHSDRAVRIKRLNERKDRKLTIEELDSREVSEAKKLWKGTLIAMADYHYINNGEDMNIFEQDLHELFQNKLNLITVNN
jgi:dephospho-CoA kinase